jgi:glycosyltransferase involved in cell wall biosynthesis
MNNNLKISVLMAAYNAEAFIEEAIASVLAQSFNEFELIIVNDGSSDNTASIVRSFKDERIIVLDQPNRGIAAALNNGLQHARAGWIARFDADDVCYPERLQVQFDFISKNPDHIIIGAAADYIDMDGRYIFTHHPPAYSTAGIRHIRYKQCPFIHSSVLYNKQVVMNAGGYDLNAHGFEDHFLWLKILDQGKSANLRQSLMQVRLNPQSFTIDERWTTRRFRSVKQQVLRAEKISEAEGAVLAEALEMQKIDKVKNGAYYALLGKKYLWNNHKPAEARENLNRSWKAQPRPAIAMLWLLSFMPQPFVRTLYRIIKMDLARPVKTDQL